MDTKIFVSTSLAENTTFQEICDRYLEEVVPTKKSARQISSVIKNLYLYFRKYSAAAMTPELVANYREERAMKVKPETVRKDLLCVK